MNNSEACVAVNILSDSRPASRDFYQHLSLFLLDESLRCRSCLPASIEPLSPPPDPGPRGGGGSDGDTCTAHQNEHLDHCQPGWPQKASELSWERTKDTPREGVANYAVWLPGGPPPSFFHRHTPQKKVKTLNRVVEGSLSRGGRGGKWWWWVDDDDDSFATARFLRSLGFAGRGLLFHCWIGPWDHQRGDGSRRRGEGGM